MNNDTDRDLIISGVAEMSGGTYRCVRVDGVGKIRGNLECTEYICNGRATVDGSVRAEKAEINGTALITGSVSATRMRVNGSSRIGGILQGEEVEINGEVKINGGCEAETFRASGGFRLNGMLNADTVDIHLYGRCAVKEIGGGTITVRAMQPWSLASALLRPFYDCRLAADVIEGDNVTLERTKAKTVRGNQVTIGPGCVIECVEYRTDLKVSENAKVIRHEKLPSGGDT